MAKLDKSYVTSIGAPTLLDLIRDTGKSSYLRQKITNKIRREKKWKYCFAVLVNTAMYIYEDETSDRPKDCINLSGYNCVKRIDSDKCLYGFAIIDTSKTKSEETFASYSDNERRGWMRQIKEHLYKSNNIPSPTPSFLLDHTVDDETEYVAIEEPLKLKDPASSGKASDSMSKSLRRNAITDMNYLDER